MDAAWRFAFFGGGACSGATIAELPAASAGATSTTFGTSAAAGNAMSDDADAVAGADAFTAAPVSAVTAAGTVAAGADGAVTADKGFADAFGLPLGGAAATEEGGDAGFAGAVIVAGVAGTGTTDGTAAVRTLVTIARAAIGVFCGSLG